METHGHQLKAEEERKRERAYRPEDRWRHLQETITWAEANLPAHLRRNRPRRRLELKGPGAIGSGPRGGGQTV